MAPDPVRLAVAFSSVIRGADIDVPVGATATFAEALGRVGLDRREGVYWAARATLVRRPEQRARFDEAFDAFWLGLGSIDLGGGEPPPPMTLAVDDADPSDEASQEEQPSGPVLEVRWSPTEVLRSKDFADCSAAELDEAARLLADLRFVGAMRRSRRLEPTSRRRGRPDARRTLRSALRTGGEPVRQLRRGPGTRPRRVVLLLDVSGSMEPYARALLRFAHVAGLGRTPVEVFALGTRLTRLTRELATHDPGAALAAAGRAVPDWSGGTRLGEGVRAFADTWGVRGMARGAILVIVSDGWDRGDPAVLGEALARLKRVVHRLVWVNPLKSTPGYAPLAAGMAAALPHLDEFVEGHSVDSLEALAAVVSR